LKEIKSINSINSKSEIENLEKLSQKQEDWNAFLHFEKHLGVLDQKALKILTVCEILLGLSGAALFSLDTLKLSISTIFFAISVFLTLISAYICSQIMNIQWASILLNKDKHSSQVYMFSFDGIRELRDKRDKNLKFAIWLLNIAVILIGFALLLYFA